MQRRRPLRPHDELAALADEVDVAAISRQRRLGDLQFLPDGGVLAAQLALLVDFVHVQPARRNGAAAGQDNCRLTGECLAHGAEVAAFAEMLAVAEVEFCWLTYRDLWQSRAADPLLADHAERLRARYSVAG